MESVPDEYKKLDLILKYCSERLSQPYDQLKWQKLAKDISGGLPDNPLFLEYLYAMNKRDTEYITMCIDQGYPDYRATIKGLILITEGGHAGRWKNDRQKAFLQTLTTLLTTIGTSVAGMYGGMEILKWLYHHVSFCH